MKHKLQDQRLKRELPAGVDCCVAHEIRADRGRYFEDPRPPVEQRPRPRTVWALVAGVIGLVAAFIIAAALTSELARFPGHFVEQDSWRLLVFLGAGAAVYVGLLAALVAPIAAGRRGRILVLAVALALLAFTIALTAFEAAALYFREDPPGNGRQRQGADHEAFVAAAEAWFLSVYLAALLLAAAVGRVLASWQVAAVAVTLVAVFMLLSFPMVEFANECNIGQPVLLPPGRC